MKKLNLVLGIIAAFSLILSVSACALPNGEAYPPGPMNVSQIA